ncbi:MAG: glycosyltransferase family 39 protein [Planctomycetia bacterium]|nr:glycosyltransferase family 39 protein [Planctomycetia bacterium]
MQAAPTTPHDSETVPGGISRRAASLFSLVWLAFAAGLLFWNLGWYPFWGDEADTVIFARNAWETGDVGAYYGDNIYIYRNGTLLEDLKNRSTPPLSYYVAAPFWGAFGDDHFWMRMPFALCGLATIGLLCRWLRRGQASATMWFCLGASVTFNVSFLLYARQCRYNALASLLTLAVAYLYVTYDGRRTRLFGIAAALILLAATHYLHFAALAVAMVVDYVLWQRRVRPLSQGDWIRLLLPTVIAVGALAAVFNPLGKNSLPDEGERSFWWDKLTLLWWSLRDINECEFGVGIIILCAPVVALWRGDRMLLRLFVACLLYVLTTTLLSPQPVQNAEESDIRYLAPLIVPCIYLTVRTIYLACAGRAWLVVPIVAFAMGTNVLNQLVDKQKWRSTIGEFVHELRHPRHVAGAILSEWLKANVKEGESVWIEPNEMTAPQIVETPNLVYAWQLDNPAIVDKYRKLPRFHFRGETSVDYIIAFGFHDTLKNVTEKALPILKERGFLYEPIATLDTFFDDRTRPELHWHWFRERPYDKTKKSIYIFRLKH